MVITLESTAERLEHFLKGWVTAGLDIPLSVFYGGNVANEVAGCYQSHVDVLSTADEPLLVLEDDAFFVDPPEFAIPDDAELFYFGGEHLFPPEPHAPGVVRVVKTRRSHAYVAMDPQGLACRLGSPHGYHYDYALSGLGLRSYAASPFFVGQRAGRSVITGTVYADDALWNDEGDRQ